MPFEVEYPHDFIQDAIADLTDLTYEILLPPPSSLCQNAMYREEERLRTRNFKNLPLRLADAEWYQPKWRATIKKWYKEVRMKRKIRHLRAPHIRRRTGSKTKPFTRISFLF